MVYKHIVYASTDDFETVINRIKNDYIDDKIAETVVVSNPSQINAVIKDVRAEINSGTVQTRLLIIDAKDVNIENVQYLFCNSRHLHFYLIYRAQGRVPPSLRANADAWWFDGSNGEPFLDGDKMEEKYQQYNVVFQ